MNQTRSQEAFLARLERHKGILHKISASYCPRGNDRDDLMQNMLAELWRAYPRYDEQRSFSTWMYRIALNVAISFYRKQSAYRQHFDPLQPDIDRAAASSDGAQEELGVLNELIATLDEFDRALVLLYLQDEPYASIAGILGISQTNVATKISRIKQRLRGAAAQTA